MLYGEFLVNAQGEDVVAGIRTPEPIAEMQRLLPEAYAQLIATLDRLEAHYRDMQDIEFTVEEGRLYLLADAHRQAHRDGRAPDRGRDGGREASSRARRRWPGSIRASSTSCSIR